MPIYALDGCRPTLSASVFVAPTATLIGDVTLGDEVGIWFGAILRGDNAPIVVGARTNVQDLTMVHVDPGFPVVIGADVTVGHRAIVHGCTVGDMSLIGMGAIVLNGARIGRHCLIGAGALVTEGQEISDGSLVVGSPGRIVRTLDGTAIAGLGASAERYVANWRRFAAGLQAVG